LCKAIDTDDVLLSQLRNGYSFGVFQDDLKRLYGAELDALQDVPLFGSFSPEVMDYVKTLEEDALFVSIQEKAPRLYDLLNYLCENNPTRTPEKQNRPRVVSILSILAFSRHQRKCNTLPAILSLLLYSSGTKKRMFEITNALGWTEYFSSVIQSVEGLKDQALDFMKEFIKKPWLVAYDNCDLKVGVSQQSDTKKNTLFSITSALLSPAIGLWRWLTQSDFKRTKLELGKFVKPERYGVMKQFTEALICETLAEVDSKSVKRLMKDDTFKKLAAFPVVDQLSVPPLDRRSYYPLMPIMISEDKTSGNIAIIQDIFRKQLNLPDDYFESRPGEPAPAIGVGGDNKTANRIWSAKYNAGNNISAFDRLEFAQVIPGLFHAEMHAVHAIIKAHWGVVQKEGRCNHSALRYAAGKMARKFVSPENMVFAHAKTFLSDVLQSKLLTEFYHHLLSYMDENGLKIGKSNRKLHVNSSPDEFNRAVRGLEAEVIVILIKKTAESVKQTNIEDIERKENLLFIRDAEVYMLLHRAIKYADIGLLKYAVDSLIFMFNGSKKHAYTREFLYIKNLIDGYGVDPEVSRMIAGLFFVNPSGRRDGFFAIDLANEYLNREIKDVWETRRHSALSVNKLAEYCTVDAIFLKPARRILESMWGRRALGKHNRANRGRVLQRMAWNFRITMERDDRRAKVTNLDWSKDLFVKGYDSLDKAVEGFNSKFMYDAADDDAEVEIQIWEGDEPAIITGDTVDPDLCQYLEELPSPGEELMDELHAGLDG
jgi:hypothetical protein